MHFIRIIGVAGFVLALLLGSVDFARAKYGDPNPEFYNGEITAVDAQAKTINVKGDGNATRIFSIEPETKIEKETQRLTATPQDGRLHGSDRFTDSCRGGCGTSTPITTLWGVSQGSPGPLSRHGCSIGFGSDRSRWLEDD